MPQRSDRDFFNANPDRNFRLRRRGPDEPASNIPRGAAVVALVRCHARIGDNGDQIRSRYPMVVPAHWLSVLDRFDDDQLAEADETGVLLAPDSLLTPVQ